MRILFDSKKESFKTPFGCLTPGETCTLSIHIPSTVKTTAVSVCVQRENGTKATEASFAFSRQEGPYDIWQGSFALEETGLFFYFFRITGHTGTFRLFKQGDDTNMEAGSLWQVSCIPADFTVPKWAMGATIYQVFPDRFCKLGDCDLTGKLTPYVLHEKWNEEVFWQPTDKGEVLNNDFYGGNFRGITEKLDTIAQLGVTILYLNPISKSFSSHRYDTGDYKTPDPMLGTLEDFRTLCDKAHEKGIRVILDGVFSHTGSNSLYFDKDGAFGGQGAYCTPESPYYSWYQFHRYPDSYESWWGFDTLPTVNKLDENFIKYIITDEDSVVAHWLSLGADGFRLDVADELPGVFLKKLKDRIREIRPDALLMGEVWEDASNKISYGQRCRYFVDGVLDSVMNYPFRTAILNYLKGADDGWGLSQAVMTILENYPKQVVACNMNLLGTHDTPRILTALVDDFDGSREALAARHLTSDQKALALERLRLATALQYTLPGSPSIYYGDEAGMEGGKDPFNRRTYPWGREDVQLMNHYKALGSIRRQFAALRLGNLQFFQAGGGRIGFTRNLNNQTIRVCINCSEETWAVTPGRILSGQNLTEVCKEQIDLGPMGYCILEDL